MEEKIVEKKFAMLIDAENISSQYIDVIMDEATKEGVITYKRIYGDWTNNNHSSWKDILLKHSLNPMQQYAYTQGKNSTDSAMIIDAMDILYTGTVDGFCIVSSDSDFTKLASRLKESGKIVIGMGKKQTPQPFVSACTKFKYIDILAEDNVEEKESQKTTKKKNQKTEDSTLTNKAKIKKSIKNIIEEKSDADGWLLASTIGTDMQNKYPDFDCRNYGHKKMINLLEDFGFEIKVSKDKTTYFVKNKN